MKRITIISTLLIVLFLFSSYSYCQERVVVRRVDGGVAHCFSDSVHENKETGGGKYFLNTQRKWADYDTAYVQAGDMTLKISGKIVLDSKGEKTTHIFIQPFIHSDIFEPFLKDYDDWSIQIKNGRGKGSLKRILNFHSNIDSKGKMYILYAKAHVDLRNEAKCYACYQIKEVKRTERRMAECTRISSSHNPGEKNRVLLLGGSPYGADITYAGRTFSTYRSIIVQKDPDMVGIQWAVMDKSRADSGNSVLIRNDEPGKSWFVPVHNGKGKGKMVKKVSSNPSIAPSGKEVYVYAKFRYNRKRMSRCALHLKLKAKKAVHL